LAKACSSRNASVSGAVRSSDYSHLTRGDLAFSAPGFGLKGLLLPVQRGVHPQGGVVGSISNDDYTQLVYGTDDETYHFYTAEAFIGDTTKAGKFTIQGGIRASACMITSGDIRPRSISPSIFTSPIKASITAVSSLDWRNIRSDQEDPALHRLLPRASRNAEGYLSFGWLSPQ